MAICRRPISAVVVLAACGCVASSLLGAPTTPRTRATLDQTSPLDQSRGVMAALDAVVNRSPDPERTRGTLLWRLRNSPTCYASGLSQAEYETLIDQTGLWPPTMKPPTGIQPRFYTDGKVWTGAGLTGDKGLATRASLTYSFPDDGASWGLSTAGYVGSNVLGARLITAFGSLDKGREYIRQSMAAWRRCSGITYVEVADDNTAQTISSTRVATRGDIRIGGFEFAATTNGILAYNAFPTNLSQSTIGGGDMAINCSYFIPSAFTLNTADYLYFRNTIAHEHGHGLGFIHSWPCDGTKLMEPTISLGPTTLTLDEIRGAGRDYGDRYSGNHSRLNAADLGSLTSPVLHSAILWDLSTNVGAGNLTNEDYFKFTIGSTQNVAITAQPTGDVAMQSQQTGNGCGSGTTLINALACGDLNVTLMALDGTVIAAAPAQPAGSPETVTVNNLAAGTYVVSIVNATSSTIASPNQFVQTYDLTVRVGTAKAPPEVIAGLSKRVQAGTPAFFDGYPNSHAVDPGSSLNDAGYEWDLDGDNAFEVNGNPRPTFTYPSNGTIPVTLRLTDSNGMSATDMISVTVFGATTSIASISPGNGTPGQSVPVTIYGANFKGVTNSTQVTVSGGGVTVSGTPSVNVLGTQITGLTFTVAAGATQTARDVTITNADGLGLPASNGTGAGVFLVGLPGQPPANDECTGALPWNGTGTFSFNNTNATTGAQQSFPSTGCPAVGPINNDVWYLWTAPTRGVATINTDSAALGFQTRIAMYRNATCPPTASVLRCDDFGTAFTANVITGGQYLLQVGSVTAGATGAANVLISIAASQGACCLNGICTTTGEGACLGTGGEWSFAATCTPTYCPQSSGACCITGSCFINTPVDCAALGAGAAWQGADTTCGQPGNPIICCPANFNHVDGLTVQDLFDFLGAWFSQNPTADFNQAGGVTLQDLFDYLSAYFTGCSG